MRNKNAEVLSTNRTQMFPHKSLIALACVQPYGLAFKQVASKLFGERVLRYRFSYSHGVFFHCSSIDESDDGRKMMGGLRN
jgi:hypothetical protein